MTKPRIKLKTKPKTNSLLDGSQAADIMKKHLTIKYRTLEAAATALGVTKGFIYLLVHGERHIPDWLALEIGLRRKRRIIYEYEVLE